METMVVFRYKWAPSVSHVLATMLFTLTCWFFCPNAYAVIVAEGDGPGNVTAPADDPGWSNVGRYGDYSATYLGHGWAISADHVPRSPEIVFGDLVVPVVTGSEVTLRNPPVESLSDEAKALLDQNGITQPTELTDLRLIPLAEDPGLPALTMAEYPPEFLLEDADVVMIGFGRDRESELSYWGVNDLGGGQFDWVEITPPADDGAGHDYRVAGYKYAATQTKRWGTNTIVADGFAQSEDHDVFSLLTQFRSDPAVATQFESQAAVGDSGGAVFYRGQSDWELVGIIYAVTPTVGGLITSGQPEDTAVFGNFTSMADLSVYRDEIMDIVASGGAVMLQAGDANQDLCFDQFDLIQVQQAAKYLTGQPATWGEGDWDGAPGGSPGHPPEGNGRFDQLDIVAALGPGKYLACEWYNGPFARAMGTSAAAAVPEPYSLLLLALGVVGLLCVDGWGRCR